MASPIITPAGPLARDGKTLTSFLANMAVTWATTNGTLVTVDPTHANWTAPNQTGVWQVSGDNGPDPETIVSITVKGILPNYWTFKDPVHAKKEVQIWRPISGPSQSRSFGDPTKAIHDWELSDDDSSYENFLEMKAFWLYHYPGRQFDMVDPVLLERRTYEFDSDFDSMYNHQDSYTWSVRIKEAYPYAVIP